MPKSKNRRKTKTGRENAGGNQNAVDANVVEGGDAPRAESGSEAAKKPSVGPIEFFQQVRSEARKITWTTRGEVLVSTIMVLIMVAIMSIFFFAVDQLLRMIVPWILSLNLFS